MSYVQEERSQTEMILQIALKGSYILSMDFCEWLVCVHVWCGSILGKRHLDLGGWKLTCSTELLLLTERCALPPCSSLGLQMSSSPQFAQLSKYLKLCKLIISWSSLWLLLCKGRERGSDQQPYVARGSAQSRQLVLIINLLSDTSSRGHSVGAAGTVL